MELHGFGGLPQMQGRVGTICACMPGWLISRGDVAGAGEMLKQLAGLANGGMVPATLNGSSTESTMEVDANLWFIAAAHAYQKAGADVAMFNAHLLPVMKRIVQGLISGPGGEAGGGIAGARMDDGGMLTVEGAGPQAMRLNALWYNAIETLAATLLAGGDRTGDHYERLAGRFRRSFAKTYWCDDHGCICGPEARANDGHGADFPELEQLLCVMLPESPIPKTKQRQIVQALKRRAVGEVGLKQDAAGRESVMHRVWLAEGLVLSAENPETVIEEARNLAVPVKRIFETQGAVAKTYLHGVAEGEPDAVATAECAGTLRRLGM